MTTTVLPAPLAVITGASSGIGKELPREFAEHGYDLLIDKTKTVFQRKETEPRSEEK